MVERKEYLDQLWAWKDEQLIKVVTGIRRCGKSTLLKQFQNRLQNTGIGEEQILRIQTMNHCWTTKNFTDISKSVCVKTK